MVKDNNNNIKNEKYPLEPYDMDGFDDPARFVTEKNESEEDSFFGKLKETHLEDLTADDEEVL